MASNIKILALSNKFRKEGMDATSAYAAAKKQVEEESSKAQETVVVVMKKGQGRGIYNRDDKWKADHAEKMKAAWARRKADGSFVPKVKAVKAEATAEA